LLGTGSALPEDLDYEISSNLVDFGRLLRVVAAGRTVPYLAGSYCHEALKSVKTPCSDCPVLRPEGGWPRVSVRALGGANGYEVVSATPHNSSIGMKFRRLPGDVLSAIFESRIGELAARADLTERERAVLKYLVMGRYLSDISTILGISLRTVKFHQGNILRKVGADSRVDLMRLMM
jgi:DNA-binding CsgD family transcriptional regulator